MANFAIDRVNSVVDMKVAICVSNDLFYGPSRIYVMVAEDQPHETEAFRDYQLAVQ